MYREVNDEVRLIRAAQDHDLAAFAALVQRHHAGVRACLAVRLDNPHDAEDLAQEVFVTAFRRIDSCDPERPMGPWLRGIAMNLLANYRRKFRAMPVGLSEELQVLMDSEIGSQFENTGEGEMLDALRECLAYVDGPSRGLLHARYAEGVSLEDLAHKLQKKPSALSMQLHRLRVVLGDCIAAKVRESSPTTTSS